MKYFTYFIYKFNWKHFLYLCTTVLKLNLIYKDNAYFKTLKKDTELFKINTKLNMIT